MRYPGKNGGDALMQLSDVTAIILAGGLGTRLSAVVPGKPKVLAQVGGRPFIEYLLDRLQQEGVLSVILCTGYMADPVEHSLGSNYGNLTLAYSREASPMGTGGALRLALPRLTADPVLVLNGDSFYETPLQPFVEAHAARRSVASILLAETDDTRRYGRVEADDQGHIARFSEKAATEGPGWINAGIYLLNRSVIEAIPAGRNVSLEHEVFPQWIGRGLDGYKSQGRFWDIGVPDAYEQANADFVHHSSR
jgi:NDP-sugar pyrophosphorylase family protein